MISICIPVYNFNIEPLISQLSKQIEVQDIPMEIIVIDDASQKYKPENKTACQDHTYIELPQNIGRSKIRNLFLEYAQHPYLLFLDGDSLVESEDFLSDYAAAIREKPSVVYGGRVYPKTPPARSKKLSWKYGTRKESQAHKYRKDNPNQSFMTHNFLIQKEVFRENQFDERLVDYGHEDTLFGFMLKNKNIEITHIDNPVVNGDIETNQEYLKKTDKGIANLVKILRMLDYDQKLMEDVALLRFYNHIKKWKNVIGFSFRLTRPLIVFILSRGYVSLRLFDFYKLGALIQNLNKAPSENTPQVKQNHTTTQSEAR